MKGLITKNGIQRQLVANKGRRGADCMRHTTQNNFGKWLFYFYCKMLMKWNLNQVTRVVYLTTQSSYQRHNLAGYLHSYFFVFVFFFVLGFLFCFLFCFFFVLEGGWGYILYIFSALSKQFFLTCSHRTVRKSMDYAKSKKQRIAIV